MSVPVRRHYVDGGFGQMHLYDAGPVEADSPPLLCFHMSPFAAVIYEPFIAAMGERRRAIAVDTPGFGNSDPPLEPPSINDYAQAMGDVIHALQVPRVDIMGYHTGSSICVELARILPERVRRVVMVSAPDWTDEEQALRISANQPVELSEDGEHLMKWWQESLYWAMAGRTGDMIGRVFYARVLNPAIIHWGHGAAYRYRLREWLPEIEQRILVLNPEDDLCELTPRVAPYLNHPASRIHDLPGWGHGFLDVKTKEAVELIGAFLDES